MITDTAILEIIAQVLEEEGEKYLEEVKGRLSTHGLQNSRLYNTLEINIDGTTLRLDLASYAQWVENGRGPGKQPPIDAIQDWITRTPGLPDNDKSLPFLIARKIGRDGIPARPFLEPGPEAEIEQRIKDELGDYLVTELLS